MAGARPINSTNPPHGAAQMATLHVSGGGGEIELTVEDSGRGIEPGMRDAVFERFFRGRPCEQHPLAHAARQASESTMPIALLSKQIDGRLGVAEKTVKVHRGQALRKLGLRSVAPTGARSGQSRCIARICARRSVSGFGGRAAGNGTNRTKVPWCRARTLIGLRRLRIFRHACSFGRVPGRADIAAQQMEIEE